MWPLVHEHIPDDATMFFKLFLCNVSFWFQLFRRCSVFRLMIFLVLILVCIQIVYVFLVNSLQRGGKPVNYMRNKDYVDEYFRMLMAIESSQVMDSSGQYTVVRNIVKSTTSGRVAVSFPALNDVLLVSQCSINHLAHVLDLSISWQGPISVAVFVSQMDIASAVSMIVKLVKCNADIFNNISLHLVFSFGKYGRKSSHDLYANDGIVCDSLRQQLKASSAGNYEQNDVAYPNNLLRNVALENSDSKYVFVIDIDMLPSFGLHSKLTNFISNFSVYTKDDPDHFAFVIPAFEMHISDNVPKTKSDVLNLWQRKILQPFYAELCWKCQKHTNYSAWRDLGSSDSLQIGYEVTWKDPWEPFYIVPKSAPKYDERFRQYGFNRISQSCELHIAGFQFLVLDGAFLVHRGFKVAPDFHANKETELNENRLLFRKFKQELKSKYPNSRRRCY